MERPIFDYTDYKLYIRERIQALPSRGRGQMAKLAAHLNINSVVISQVFKGDRELTAEQALLVAEYFGFTALEREYFVFQVSKVRAGNHQLQSFYDKKLLELKAEWSKVKSRVSQHRVLTEEQKAIYYSSWQYGAVRLLSSLEGKGSVKSVCERFQLTEETATRIVDFLLQQGLCTGKLDNFEMGDLATFVDSSSPFVSNHRRNWRIKGFEFLEKLSAENIFYSSPVSISKSDQQEFREELLKLIGRYSKRIQNTAPETLCCLNIDWFEL